MPESAPPNFVMIIADQLRDREDVFTEGGFLGVEIEQVTGGGPFPYDLKQRVEHDHPECVGKVVAVRSRDWTYVWRLHEPPELYDRHDDPDELHNLAGLSEHAAREAQLRSELLRWFVATGDIMPREPDPRFPEIDLPAPARA
jgi:arylsulfatase A-like enzyme